MALPISMFTKGLLITIPPCIYIFMGEIPVNSLIGGVASVSQDMSSDDPNVLPPTPESPQDSKALPSDDLVVDNGTTQDSKSGVSIGDPEVVNEIAKESDPEVDKGVTQDSIPKDSDESSRESAPVASSVHSSDSDPGVTRSEPEVDSGIAPKDPVVSSEPSKDNVPATDDLSNVDGEDTDEEEEEEPTADPSENEKINEKLKDAGIDSSCFLQNLKTVGKCTLTKEQMEKINFPQKDSIDEDGDFEITGLGDDEKVTLTIESGYDEEDFPEGGLRLTFNNPNSNEVKITGDGNSDASLMPNIDHDYKFSLSIEKWIDKAWSSLQKLGAKVGLNINDSLSDDPCATGQEINKKINVWKNKNEYVIGAESTSSENCLMKSTENNQNHLEGFILTVKDGEDISLKGGDGPSGGKTIDTLKKNVSYSIAPKRVGGKKVWFLIEMKS